MFLFRRSVFVGVVSLSLILFSCEKNPSGSNRISRVYSVYDEAGSEVTRSLSFSYDEDDRVVGFLDVSTVKNEDNQIRKQVKVVYDYISGDTVLIEKEISRVSVSSGHMGPVSEPDPEILERCSYKAILNNQGRVDSLVSRDGGGKMGYLYNTQGCLRLVSSVDAAGGVIQDSGVNILWDNDGVLHQVVSGRGSIGLDYSVSPFDNSFSVDLVLMFVELRLFHEIPMWGIGLLGNKSEYLPQKFKFVDAQASHEVEIICSTDGTRLVGVVLKQDGVEESWVIEYQD